MAAARFTVTKPGEEEVPITDSSRDGYGSYDGAHVQSAGKGECTPLFLLHHLSHPCRENCVWGGGAQYTRYQRYLGRVAVSFACDIPITQQFDQVSKFTGW